MKKSTTPLGLNGIYVGRDRSAAQYCTPSPTNPGAVPQITPVPIPTMQPPPRPIVSAPRPVITKTTPAVSSVTPTQVETHSNPPQYRAETTLRREERVTPPPAKVISPPKTKSILKKPTQTPAFAPASPTSDRTSGESRDNSVSPHRRDRTLPIAASSSPPAISTGKTGSKLPSPPVKKSANSAESPISLKGSSVEKSQGSLTTSTTGDGVVSAHRERKLNSTSSSPGPSVSLPGKRDIAAGISRPVRVLPQSTERGGSESSWRSQSNHVGKTLRSQKMEARLRNAPDDDRESDYYSQGSYESQSQGSYSTYGDSSSYRGGRNQVYQPDTKTFGVGGALAVRTQRILEKQKKLEGLSAERTRREYGDQSMLSTIQDDGGESEENERSEESTSVAARGGGSGSPVVYYVMPPGGIGTFPPGYQFPPGFDPSILTGIPPGARAVGPDGKPLSEDAKHNLESQRVAAMQQYMLIQQMMTAQGGVEPARGSLDPAAVALLMQLQQTNDPHTGGIPGGVNSQTLANTTQTQQTSDPHTGGIPGGVNAQTLANTTQPQQTSDPHTGGIPGGVNAQTLALAEQLIALNAHKQARDTSVNDVPLAVPDDPLGIDLQTLLMAKQLAMLNEKLKSAGDVEGGAQVDPNALFMLLAQLGAANAPPAPLRAPPMAAEPDMSAVHDTLTQMREMMLAMQKMQMQCQTPEPHPQSHSTAPLYKHAPPLKRDSPPAHSPEVVPPPAPPSAPEPEYRKTQRELPSVLYRLVPHRSKFKRANELFEADIDIDYCSDENSSVKSSRSGGSSRNRAQVQSANKKREKAKKDKRGEEADFSLESFAPPRNGGVGGGERYTVSPSPEGKVGSRKSGSDKKDGSKVGKKDKSEDGVREARTSQFKFDNPLLSPADPTPRKSQDDFWIDPSIEDPMVDKFRRDSKDDLEIERKSSLLSLSSNTALYKKKVDLTPGHRRENLRDSYSSTSSGH